MEFGISNINSSIQSGNTAIFTAKSNAEKSQFSELLEHLKNQDDKKGTVASSQIAQNGRLNGEFTTGFQNSFKNEVDKNSLPKGAAINQANPNVQPKKIDRTSELFEKSMELESYFVKQMLSAMRKTVMKNKESDFAQQTYEDMLFDEYATSMTKNASFGLADQIYLSLI